MYHVRHLEDALRGGVSRDEFHERTRRGLVVCRCPELQQLTQRVLAVPWQRL